MHFNRYKIGFFIRIIILTLTLALLMYWLFVEPNYLRCVYLLVVVGYLIWSIFWNVNRISRDFYTFVSALANEEYAVQFNDEKGSRDLQMLYHLYNTTAKRFQHVKEERDLQHLFLEEILNQIEVGILAFDTSEKIMLVNKAFHRLFSCKKPQYLSDIDSDLKAVMKGIKLGDRKLIFPTIHGEKLTLSAHSTDFSIKGKGMKLVYFHNIKTEMDEQELDSWQKLFSVLTHEIMNSVTPISSLSSSMNEKLKRDLGLKGTAEPRTLNQLSEGLEAVAERTRGLLSFTESFRKLSKIPQPRKATIRLDIILERINTLFSHSFQLKNITLRLSLPKESFFVTADQQQLEQLLINLIKNAEEAIDPSQHGTISVESSNVSDGRVEIQISDNGKGIPPEMIEKVFVPFFTTKSKGNGIGLSLCRQIVRLHGGSIELKSKMGEGTRVIVRL